MKRYAAGVAFALAAFATPAAADQINVSVSGTLTNSLGMSSWHNTGVDPNLAVGSVLTLTASFDAGLLIPWGDSGYSVVGLYGLPTTGPSFYRVDGGGMTWQTTDMLTDFQAVYTYRYYVAGQPFVNFSEGGPAIIIQGDKVVGVTGWLQPTGATPRPGLSLGSNARDGLDEYDSSTPGGPITHSTSFPTISLSGVFGIYPPDNEYGNRYNTPGFSGTWDFANSSVTDPPGIIVTADAISAAPEPNTWTMLIIGFGAIGFAMRRRNGTQSELAMSAP